MGETFFSKWSKSRNRISSNRNTQDFVTIKNVQTNSQILKINVRLAIFACYLIIFLDILAVSLFIPHLVINLKNNLNLTNAHLSLILPTYGLVQIFSCPFVGLGGDLYGRKSLLMYCLALTACSYAILGFSSNWLFIFATRAFAGLFKQTQLLGKGILADLASQSPHGHHDLSTLVGNSEAFGSMGFIFGPAIGSYLTSSYFTSDDSFYYLCLIASLILIINIAIAATLIPSSGLLQANINRSRINSSPPTQRNEFNIIEENDENQNEIRLNTNSISEQPEQDQPLLFIENQPSISISTFVAISFFFCVAIHTVRECMPIFILEKYSVSTTDYGYIISTQAIICTSITFISGPIISTFYPNQEKRIVVHSGILQLISVVLIYLNNISYQAAWSSLLFLTIANQYLGVGLKSLALQNTTNSGSILGFSQTATAVSRTFASILTGMYINNCDIVIIFGCVSSMTAVFITWIFVEEKLPKMKNNYGWRNLKEKLS